MEISLAGRTLLITGASSGIGANFAGVAAAAGAKVVLGARRTDRLDALVKEIKAKGGEAIAVKMDVSDHASTVAAFDAAESAFGPVDSVIANAGMSLDTPFLEHTGDEFDALMAVNLKGVFLTVQEAAKRMMAANPDGIYKGIPPDILMAIPVMSIELHADGSVRNITVMRYPSQARETVDMAVAAIKRAAPFGDVSKLPKPWKFNETFLFNADRKFKPMTLDQR